MGTYNLKKYVNHNNENLLYIESISILCKEQTTNSSSNFKYIIKCNYRKINTSKTISAKISQKPFDISESILTNKQQLFKAQQSVTLTFTRNNKFQTNHELFLVFQIHKQNQQIIICDQCVQIHPFKKINVVSNTLEKEYKTQMDKILCDDCIKKIEAINTFYDAIIKQCDEYLKKYRDDDDDDDSEHRSLNLFKEYIGLNNKAIDKINGFYNQIDDDTYIKKLILEKLKLTEKDLAFINNIDPKLSEKLTEIEKLTETIEKLKKIYEDLEGDSSNKNNAVNKRSLEDMITDVKNYFDKTSEIHLKMDKENEFFSKSKEVFNQTINEAIEKNEVLNNQNEILEKQIKKLKEKNKTYEDYSPDPKFHFRASVNHFYKLLLRRNHVQTKSKNEAIQKILNNYQKNNLNEQLKRILPNQEIPTKNEQEFFSSRIFLIKDGIYLVQTQANDLPENLSINKTYQFMDSINLKKLEDEVEKREEESFDQDQWKSYSAYELFKRKLDAHLMDIKKQYEEKVQTVTTTSDDQLKEIINDFMKNRLLPFIEREMDEIIEYHEKSVEKNRARKREDLEQVRQELLDLATLEPIKVREKSDTFDPAKHIKVRDEHNSQLPDMVILRKIREGYFCVATNTVIRPASVEVNYNFSG